MYTAESDFFSENNTVPELPIKEFVPSYFDFEKEYNE